MTDRGAATGLTRDRPIEPRRTALLLVDVQNWVVNDRQAAIRPEFDAAVRATVLPNMIKLVEACRRALGWRCSLPSWRT
jgi:isochorismate hydrolase